MPLAVPYGLSIFGFNIFKSQKERRHASAGTLLHMRVNLYLEANQTRTYGGEIYLVYISPTHALYIKNTTQAH